MAASKVKDLLDQLAATLAEMGMLDEAGAQEEAGESVDGSEVAPRSSLEIVEERQNKYDALLAKASKLEAAIKREETFEARRAELTKAMTRTQPASEVSATRIQPMALHYRGKLRAFESVESAHRCGMWLKAHFGDINARQWCQDNDVERRDMGGQVNSLGGVLIPEDFSNTIIRLVEKFGVASTIAQNVQMSSDTLLVPRRISGVTGYWIGEGSTITTSDPTASMVQLVVKKFAAATRVSNELLADNAISVADWLAQEYALTMAKGIDDAFFVGDSTSSYGGINGLAGKINDGTHTASIATAATGNTTVALLDIDDYLNALSKLPRFAIGTSAWYMHPSVYHNSVQRLMVSSGTAGTGTIGALSGGNTAANLAQGTPNTFMGLPVVWVLSMTASSSLTAGSIAAYVGDLSLSSIYAEKSGMQVASSVDRYFEADQTAFRAIQRLDIVHHSLGTTTEAGPVVAIKLAAS